MMIYLLICLPIFLGFSLPSARKYFQKLLKLLNTNSKFIFVSIETIRIWVKTQLQPAVVLVSLLLTLNIFHTFSKVSIVKFEQVNTGWEKLTFHILTPSDFNIMEKVMMKHKIFQIKTILFADIGQVIGNFFLVIDVELIFTTKQQQVLNQVFMRV